MTRVQVEFDSDIFTTLRRSPEEVAREMRLAAAVIWYAQGRISQSRAALQPRFFRAGIYSQN